MWVACGQFSCFAHAWNTLSASLLSTLTDWQSSCLFLLKKCSTRFSNFRVPSFFNYPRAAQLWKWWHTSPSTEVILGNKLFTMSEHSYLWKVVGVRRLIEYCCDLLYIWSLCWVKVPTAHSYLSAYSYLFQQLVCVWGFSKSFSPAFKHLYDCRMIS